MTRALRPLLLTALVLALVILGSSATLRLSANGIGCSPWPSCYGLLETANQVQGSNLIKALRLTHRLTATLFAILALVIVAIGWRGWARPAKALGLALVGVTGVLAWVGLHTPSPLPMVTVVNVLGGLALVALCAALLSTSTPPAGSPGLSARLFVRRTAWTLLALLALQAALGAMISARLAGSACAVDCQQLTWSAEAATLLNPLLSGPVAALSVDTAAGQSLHWLHRIVGAALLVIAITLIYIGGLGSGSTLSWLWRSLAAAFSLGVISAIWEGQLLTTISHALLAGWVAAALGVTLMALSNQSVDRP